MGRITPSFRTLFVEEVYKLRKGFRKTLLDPEHQRAFDDLVGVWSREAAAMIESGVPAVLDNMNLLANVHTKTEMERLKRRLKELEKRIEAVDRS